MIKNGLTYNMVDRNKLKWLVLILLNPSHDGSEVPNQIISIPFLYH